MLHERSRRRGEEARRGSPDSRSLAGASGPGAGDAFEEFWKLRLKRDGPDPREPARRAFAAAMRGGADPSAIIAGMRRFAEVHADKRGTRYVARTEKGCLRKPGRTTRRRCCSTRARSDKSGCAAMTNASRPGTAIFLAKRQRGAPTDARGGWLFASEWPPGDPRNDKREPAGPAPLPFLNAVRVGGGGR